MGTDKKTMVRAAFAADALSLGGHWVYNAGVIAKKFGRLDSMQAPLGKTYHPTKKAGEFTHYGDQTLVLLESVAREGRFDLAAFSRDWQALLDGYDGYFDHATKDTLINFKNGKAPEKAGSESTDFSGAARIAPVVYAHHQDRDAMIAACRAQTAMTHNSPEVVAASEFLARVLWHVLQGQAPTKVMAAVASEEMNNMTLAGWVAQGMESAGKETLDVIADFGQACAISMAFPATVHLVARYEEDLESALVENVMAGGDSAARGMVAGMLLGAGLGEGALPKSWLEQMNQTDQIDLFLAKMP
ncbi:MAG: ADP-ribosylglycohydrolase family protein [Desulfobacterales bacterium]|nr:ADP-ribosylglycohydrolase family protein [Desulfobacterales bacterium]